MEVVHATGRLSRFHPASGESRLIIQAPVICIFICSSGFSLIANPVTAHWPFYTCGTLSGFGRSLLSKSCGAGCRPRRPVNTGLLLMNSQDTDLLVLPCSLPSALQLEKSFVAWWGFPRLSCRPEALGLQDLVESLRAFSTPGTS